MRSVKNELADALLRAAQEHREKIFPVQDAATQAKELQETLREILSPPRFGVGDLITQRKDNRRYKYPEPGTPCIVSHWTMAPQEPSPDGDNSYPVGRNDITILVRAGDEWVEFAVESWRFERWEPSDG